MQGAKREGEEKGMVTDFGGRAKSRNSGEPADLMSK